MWMTIEETSDYLRISKETIYRLAKKGELPASKIGNQWRFNLEKLENWLISKDPSANSKNESKERRA